jgi:CheY-like chemotaxis protein
VPCRLYVTKSRNHFHNDEWELIQSETLKFFDKFCGYKSKIEDIFKKDILIIDDELLITKTLTSLLRKNGFVSVSAVNSGAEALHKIQELRDKKNKEFDLIVTDIRMPGIDGIETVKRIKQIIAQSDGRESSVIFMTGYGGERENDARAVGYVDYLHKPFDTEDFLASIKKHLE